MQKISPYLWFDGQAEEAATFYTSLFANSTIKEISRYGEAGPGPAGSVLVVAFEIEGQEFYALNGGPMYHFTPAVSFMVNCETQEEVDRLWSALCEGGEPQPCGWLVDKFGLSWQIVPTILGKLMSDPDPIKAQRVTEAMLKMQKLDIQALQDAYDHP